MGASYGRWASVYVAQLPDLNANELEAAWEGAALERKHLHSRAPHPAVPLALLETTRRILGSHRER